VRVPRAISRLIRRQLVLGTAVVCLLGQASAFAHLALVRHATCPEHEDALVHAGAATGSADAAKAPADLTPGRRVVAPPPGTGDGHEDDHCLMAAFRRSDLVGPDGDAGQALPAADLPAPPAQAPAVRAGPVPLLRLAPKSSPPHTVG
jgi:hypothetical protein